MLQNIPVDAASELAFGSDTWLDEDAPGEPDLIFIEDETVGKRRWEIDHWIVFRHGEQFYGFDYAEPATEYQETSIEDRFTEDPVPVTPLRAEPVTVTTYVPA